MDVCNANTGWVPAQDYMGGLFWVIMDKDSSWLWYCRGNTPTPPSTGWKRHGGQTAGKQRPAPTIRMVVADEAAEAAIAPAPASSVGGGGGGACRADSIITYAPFICPKKKIGPVIGKGGEVIRRLQEETGARISLDRIERILAIDVGRANASNVSGFVFKLFGTAAQCASAKARILRLLDGEEMPMDPPTFDQINKEALQAGRAAAKLISEREKVGASSLTHYISSARLQALNDISF